MKTKLPRLEPMMAKSTPQLPIDTSGYACEVKWDGIRALAYIESSKLQLLSRNGFDITFRYPELHALSQAIGPRSIILDGEIVAFQEDGRPSFALLQRRMNLEKSALIEQIARTIPVTYVIFDVLHLDEQSLIEYSYEKRRHILSELKLSDQAWTIPAYQTEKIAEFLEASRKLELEGILIKRLNSPYLAGKRSDAWLKVKNFLRQEFIIAGWTAGAGNRAGTIGALLLGYYDVTPEIASRAAVQQRLLYAGSCGTGFTGDMLKKLKELLQPLVIANNPFTVDPQKSGAFFTQPILIGEFSFAEWTAGRTLRHPSFQGLRRDKDPRYVIREI
jgi:bifunctional non-homologous end joining protein LigD